MSGLFGRIREAARDRLHQLGGQQIASVGKIINVEMQYLQFPAAAANAVILILTTLMIIFGMTRIVDVRKEL